MNMYSVWWDGLLSFYYVYMCKLFPLMLTVSGKESIIFPISKCRNWAILKLTELGVHSPDPKLKLSIFKSPWTFLLYSNLRDFCSVCFVFLSLDRTQSRPVATSAQNQGWSKETKVVLNDINLKNLEMSPTPLFPMKSVPVLNHTDMI